MSLCGIMKKKQNMYLLVDVDACQNARAEVRGQLEGVGSPFPLWIPRIKFWMSGLVANIINCENYLDSFCGSFYLQFP